MPASVPHVVGVSRTVPLKRETSMQKVLRARSCNREVERRRGGGRQQASAVARFSASNGFYIFVHACQRSQNFIFFHLKYVLLQLNTLNIDERFFYTLKLSFPICS
jgi:hypothetical protein